jgi:hypothetical protein
MIFFLLLAANSPQRKQQYLPESLGKKNYSFSLPAVLSHRHLLSPGSIRPPRARLARLSYAGHQDEKELVKIRSAVFALTA